MYGEKEFSEEVIDKFGSFIPNLGFDPEMLHTQMSYLAESIRNNVSCKNEILEFIESILQRDDAILEIENAVAISFIELSELADLGLQKSIPQEVFRVLREQDQRWLNAKNT